METVIAILILINICFTICLLVRVFLPVSGRTISPNSVELLDAKSDQTPTLGSVHKRVPVVNDDLKGYIAEENERLKNEATTIAERARASLPVKRRIASHL